MRTSLHALTSRLSPRPWRLFAAVLAVVLVAAIALTWQRSRAENGRKVEALVLTGEVSWTGGDFRVENRDSFAWNRCKLEVNGQSYGDGYGYLVETVSAGRRLSLPMRAFLKSGQQYDASREAPGRFTIRCQDANGQVGVYVGRAKSAE